MIKVNKTVNLSKGINLITNKKMQQIIYLVGHAETQGNLIFQKNLVTELGVDKGLISRYVKKLRDMELICKKILKLTARGKEWLTFYTIGYGMFRYHNLSYKLKVRLSPKGTWKNGQPFTNGQRKSYNGYKLEGEFWHAHLYLPLKIKFKLASLHIYFPEIYANETDDLRIVEDHYKHLAFKDLEKRGIIPLELTVERTPKAHVGNDGHPLATHLLDLGLSSSELWADRSCGRDELETKSIEDMEALHRALNLIGGVK